MSDLLIDKQFIQSKNKVIKEKYSSRNYPPTFNKPFLDSSVMIN